MSLKSNIKWVKDGDTWRLHYGEDQLISLGKYNQGVRQFQLEDHNFKFVLKSGWTTKWKIFDEFKEELLTLNFGFWTSKGKVRFNDGSLFECSYQTLPKFSLDFKDLRYGQKLISYQMDSEAGISIPKLILHKNEMFTDKLLFLLCLGMVMMLHMYDNEIDFTTFILLTTA